MKKNRAGILALALALAGPPALAQVRVIKGKVVDEQKAPVEGALVSIDGTDIKRHFETKTNKKGEYFYSGIPYGRYRVSVKKEGFSPEEISGIEPRTGDENVFDFTLRKGGGVLASELSPEQLEELKKQVAEAEKQQQAVGQLKQLMEAGMALSGQGKYDEAVAEFKKALELDAQQAYVWANLADTYAKAQRYPEALEAFNKAIELQPNEAAFHQNLGSVYARMGKQAEAEAAFKKAAEMNPGGAAQNWYNMGATYVNAGKTQEAVAAFQKAIELDPKYAKAYYQLGVSLIGTNKIPEGVQTLKKFVELAPNDPDAAAAKEIVKALSN
ncbi:MAG: tetratricopeptide repeat protein [Acidobacteria bacterium]|nr:tetratricopeptide repeat protein [Acidobacteriota bacterium]